MAFADLLQLEGAGVVWLLDVSTDDFVSVTNRWATGSHSDGTNRYEARIVQESLGRLQRSLGVEHFPVANNIQLVIDNADGSADWLCDRANFLTSAVKARFRLKLGLYDPRTAYSAHPTLTVQQMGEFVLMDFPSRDNATVKLTLGDDAVGKLADLTLPPSINTWVSDGGSDAESCPIGDATYVEPLGDWGAPIQLVFGAQTLRIPTPHIGLSQAGGGTDWYGVIPFMATTNTTDMTGTTGLRLAVEFKKDLVEEFAQPLGGTLMNFPQTSTAPGVTAPLWSLERSQALTSDGKTWHIYWLKLNMTQLRPAFTAGYNNKNKHGGGPTPSGGTSPLAYTYPQPTTVKNRSAGIDGSFWESFAAFHVFNGNVDSRHSGDTYNGVWFVHDLIAEYSRAEGGDIDIDSFRFLALALAPNTLRGVVQPAVSARSAGQSGIGEKKSNGLGDNKLREALGEILASLDCDLFITWTGSYRLKALALSVDDFAATRIAFDETRINHVSDRTPSQGERWSPYNRLFVAQRDGEVTGPYDHPTAVASWDRVLSRTIQATWQHDIYATQEPQLQAFPWQTRLVEAEHRPIVTFLTDAAALQCDLGDHIEVTWTRMQGGSTPYSSAIFRVESISVDMKTLEVAIEAVWVNDLFTEYSYILDDEDFPEVAAGSGGRTITVANGDATITFSSGNLVSDGVEVGDILIVQDAATAADNFSNDRATRITAVTDATHLEVVQTAWTNRSGLQTWRILKGATTYPTAVDDPTNYPIGGLIYGKVGSESDEFSDASDANKLREG